MRDKKNRPRAARSLTFTLTIFLAVFSIMTLIAAQSPQIVLSQRNLNTAIANQQQLMAQEAGATVANFIQQNFSVLETAVELGNPVTADAKAQTDLLQSILGVQPAFRQLILLNLAGQEVAGISGQSLSLSTQFKSQLQEDVLAQAKAGQRYIGSVYIDELSNEPLVAMAVPAQDVFGDIQGALVAELNLKFMWDLVDRLKVGETGYAYVVDNHGTLIAFRDTARVLRAESLSEISQVKEFIENPSSVTDIHPEVTAYTGLIGEQVVGTYLPLGTPQWAVVIEIPSQEAFRSSNIQRNVSVISALLIIILAAAFGRYIARRIAAPLIDLSSAASDIASGNLSRDVKVAGPAEVAQVASTFNIMTSRLRELIDTLEQRVADRTKALTTSAEVSRRLSTILNERQLIVEVVEQLRAAFDYYHVHIYLLDETSGDLIMAGGSGDAGATLLGRNHKISKGKGLVGRSAQNNIPVLVSDTSKDPGWLPNPLLPETKSEAAVPIATADKVLGVLDVQHQDIGGLKQEDVDLLQSLANQIAIALLNARSYVNVQQRADREARITSIGLKIKSTTSIEAALQAVARELGRTLGANDIRAILEAPGLTQHSQKPD